MLSLGFILASPMDSPFLKATLEGLQRLLAKLVVKKAPIAGQDGQGHRKESFSVRLEIGHSMPTGLRRISLVQ